MVDGVRSNAKLIGFEDNESLDQVITQLRDAFDEKHTRSSSDFFDGLCLGRADYLLEANDGCVTAIIEQGIISSHPHHPWKFVQLEFDSGPTPIPPDSKRERRWLKLQTKIQLRIHSMARSIQQKLDLDETQIRVDGNMKQDINPYGDIIHRGTAIIHFSWS